MIPWRREEISVNRLRLMFLAVSTRGDIYSNRNMIEDQLQAKGIVMSKTRQSLCPGGANSILQETGISQIITETNVKVPA